MSEIDVRPIEFRAWDTERKIMYDIAMPTWNGCIEVWKDNKPQTEIISLSRNGPEEQGILMQYTGLLDKHGKRIFEGDILACKFFPELHVRINWNDVDCVGSVVWDYESFGFEAVNAEGDKRYPHFIDLNPKESEVIGNIHENPELLSSQ